MNTGMPNKRWLAHYDPDVAPTLAPYPEKTLLDYLAQLARENGDNAALLFKGATMTYRQLEHESDAFAAALAAMQRPSRRSRRARAPELSAVHGRRVRHLESRRHRRGPEPHIYRAGARGGARFDARVHGGDADAVLLAPQERAGTYTGPACHRDLDQGVLAASAAPAVHPLQGEAGRPPRLRSHPAISASRICSGSIARRRGRRSR